MLVDANILLYATDATSPFHETARDWLTDVLNGRRRVGLPVASVAAFARISTHPRVMASPLTAQEAAHQVDRWLDAPAAWVPPAGDTTARVLTQLLVDGHATGNLVTDAALAALAIEHGLEVATADADFARFPGVRWFNPVA